MKYDISGIAKMIVELRNGTIKAYSTDSSEKVNEALRAKFSEMLPAPRANGTYRYRDLYGSSSKGLRYY